jgi:hypothetical protein
MKKRLMAGLATGALMGAMVAGSAGSALAGERNGQGDETPIRDKANSECAFSGLEDHDFVDPVEPGVVQNWGHAKDAPVVVSAPRGASDVVLNFGGGNFDGGCNAHLHPNK